MSNIPRKMHVDDAINDAELWAICERLEVLLDGEPQTACLSYDIDAGQITRLNSKDWRAVEVLTGKVEVREKV